jgi:Uma2 family endonuclease
MTTAINIPVEVGEQRFALTHVSWETYESLLADYANASSPRFTFCEGTLEIVSPSSEHEELNRLLDIIADIIAEEAQTEFRKLGSTTFRREDLKGGAEPDSCFYIQSADAIRGKKEIDLKTDPPPDLVIEIEMTNPLVSKLPLYASLRVPEIWLYEAHVPRILRLSLDQYHDSNRSGVFPSLTRPVLAEFMEKSKSMTTLAWRRMVREWAREHSR